MKLKLIFMLLLGSKLAFAQQSTQLDLDADGILDNVTLANIETGFSLEYKLSTQKNKAFVTKIITSGGTTNGVSASKNVLVLKCQFMRGENYFKFRYDAKLKQVKLIGYDNVQYGTANQNGSGTGSLNLATQTYEGVWNVYDQKQKKLVELPKTTKKVATKTYILKNFDDAAIAELDQINYKNLPKQLQ